MKTRFFFDVESESLQGEGFAYGYVVFNVNEETKEYTLLEQGECYSIEGAQKVLNQPDPWVKNNVIPTLTLLSPYLEKDITTIDVSSLPNEIVKTTEELRDKFYQIYSRWKEKKAEFWSDVNYPVETNFLSAIVKDGKGSRDWEMPFPLLDVANFVHKDIPREDYANILIRKLTEEPIRKHNPLDDSLASACSLQRYEIENKNELALIQNRQNHYLELINNGKKIYDFAPLTIIPNLTNVISNMGSPVYKLDNDKITENQISGNVGLTQTPTKNI